MVYLAYFAFYNVHSLGNSVALICIPECTTCFQALPKTEESLVFILACMGGIKDLIVHKQV